MPSEEKRSLRIHGAGDVQLHEVAGALAAIDTAYNGALLFLYLFDRLAEIRFDYPRPLRIWDPFFWSFQALPPRRRRRRVALVPDFADSDLAELVLDSDRLVLRAVRLESPGWWDVFGKLNPLEVIREYLKDRNERRKDEDYRNAAERERLLLENQLRENQVLRERIKIAKELGATEQDLAPMKNSLLGRPLHKLGQFQDAGILGLPELRSDKKESE